MEEMQEREIPPIPLKVRELGITEAQWKRAHSMPLANGIRDIAMLLKISPKLLMPEAGRSESSATDLVSLRQIQHPENLALSLDEEEYARKLPFIELDLVDPNPFQPVVRTEFDRAEIEVVTVQLTEAFRQGDLSAFVLNIRKNPANPAHYQLIYGHLRLEAARRIGVKVLPGVISQVNDQQMFRQLIEENEQRCRSSIVSVAMQVRFARDKFNWNLQQLARLYNRAEATISQLYRLSCAPKPFLEFVHDHEEYARVVTEITELRLDESQQASLLELLHRPEMTPGLVRKHLQALPASSPASSSSAGAGHSLKAAPEREPDVVDAVYFEYRDDKEEQEPVSAAEKLAATITEQLSNSTTSTSLAGQSFTQSGAEPYMPKPTRPLHLAVIDEDEDEEEDFSPITPQEKSLLEKLEVTLRQIETLAEREGLSDEFSLNLIETSQRFTRFL